MMHARTTWHHIRRSPYQAMSAVLIMMLTFLAVSVFTILIIGSGRIISYFESKPQVTAFFRDNATGDQVQALKNELIATGKVSSMKYVSKQDALKIYREQNKNDPLLLDLVTADVLPASLEISSYNLQDLPALSQFIKSNQAVQEVVYQQDVVSALSTWTNAIRIIGALLIGLLSLVSIFIMSIIIGMKISYKKDEIEVMQLIGATKWYISGPFVLEGISYGLLGAVFGWLVSSIALLAATPLLESFLRGIPLLPAPWWFYLAMLSGELILAALLGVFASILAVMRYIK